MHAKQATVRDGGAGAVRGMGSGSSAMSEKRTFVIVLEWDYDIINLTL